MLKHLLMLASKQAKEKEKCRSLSSSYLIWLTPACAPSHVAACWIKGPILTKVLFDWWFPFCAHYSVRQERENKVVRYSFFTKRDWHLNQIPAQFCTTDGYTNMYGLILIQLSFDSTSLDHLWFYPLNLKHLGLQFQRGAYQSERLLLSFQLSLLTTKNFKEGINVMIFCALLPSSSQSE